jgi:hypothetical protein
MKYVIGTLLITILVESFIVWYGTKYGFIRVKRKKIKRDKK